MARFEYAITRHGAEEFQQLVYFCTDQGECSIRELPQDQLGVLTDVMNERGTLGWEVVQVFFGKDGIVILWKRVAEIA